MAVDCTPSALAADAKCFVCLTTQQAQAVQTYLLAVIAGVSTDPAVLMENAKCFVCLTSQQRDAIKTYLLCVISGL